MGSGDEVPGRTGFAHLFEHLMFQGSLNVASGGLEQPEMVAGGSVNGTTSFDRTNYFEAVPVGALRLALWLEADRLATLLEAVDQDSLKFIPTSLKVKVGDIVYFKNSETALHTVTIEGKNESGNMKKDAVFTWTPKTAGEYKITCDFHPQMKATITVE